MNLRTIKISRIVRDAAIKNIVKSDYQQAYDFFHRPGDKEIEDNNKFLRVTRKVDSMSSFEKIKTVLRYLNNFSNIKDAANELLSIINRIAVKQTKNDLDKSAQLSKKVGKVAAILWVISFIVVLGVAGADQDGKIVIPHNQEIEGYLAVVSSLGLSTLVTILSYFLKEKEETEDKSQRSKLYQGPRNLI